MDVFFWGTAIFLLVNAFICLYRAYRGPTAVDRILAVNIVGTKTLVVLVLLAFVFDRGLYIDVAFVYALLNLVATLAASRFLETGRFEEEWQQ
ncbi:MAG: monovalent cation/H+ antiporter complex subunit F [Actinomycetota bacterium]|nr:monovalent cation/H+ antiporter complex subunit F [Actinomycetota bacterium]